MCRRAPPFLNRRPDDKRWQRNSDMHEFARQRHPWLRGPREASFTAALDHYKALLGEARTSTPEVPDVNLDTGGTTAPGVYFMSDNVRAKLLEKLAEQDFAGVTPGIRANLLHFYSDPNAPYATKRDAKQWNKLQIDLKKLKEFAVPASAGQDLHTLD